VTERRVNCDGEIYVILAHDDGTVAIKDGMGKHLASWPMTISLKASTVATGGDADLCAHIARMIGRRMK
jgi:hypothetical protein